MIDLHTHSAASDGSDTPSELMAHALEIGLHGIALTDHDTVSGIPEFLESAAGKEIRAVPGLEISSTLYNKEIHILGLFIDHTSEKLREFLKAARENRNIRNTLILQKLNAMHYEITQKELNDCAGGEASDVPILLRFLWRKDTSKRRRKFLTAASSAARAPIRRVSCRTLRTVSTPSMRRAGSRSGRIPSTGRRENVPLCGNI